MPYRASSGPISNVVCLGAGNIGAGWVAHFMRAGLEVVVYDPVPAREEWLSGYLDEAMPDLVRLGLAEGADTACVRFTTDLEDALAGASFIQESTPEDLPAKVDLFERVTAIAPADAIVASSSAGFLARDLRARARFPERVIIGHPFNPPYLIPLVEIAGGEEAPDAAAKASRLYEATGCEVVSLNREIAGYIGNRIQAAVFKEVMYLYAQGIADVDAIDRAVTAGPSVRWAVMGPSSVFYLGTRDPAQHGEFVEGLVDEIANGFVAPSDFIPDKALIDRYAKDVAATIGRNGQQPLLRKRNDGVLNVRHALSRMEQG